MDDIDRFIADHSRSMSQREIAQRVGLSKSSVSRRLSRMRDEGAVDDGPARSAASASGRARSRAASSAPASAERLAALRELRDRLKDELGQSGGASLARVASEYRRTLEEIDALGDGEPAGRKALNPLQLARLRVKVRAACAVPGVDDVFDAVAEELRALGLVEQDGPGA